MIETLISLSDYKKLKIIKECIYYNEKTTKDFLNKTIHDYVKISDNDSVIEITGDTGKVTEEWVKTLNDLGFICEYDGLSILIYKKDHNDLSYYLTTFLANYISLNRKTIITNMIWLNQSDLQLTVWERFILAHYSNKKDYNKYSIIPKVKLKSYKLRLIKYKKLQTIFNTKVDNDISIKISNALDSKNLKTLKKLLCWIKK